jgi:hypothetical protein
LQRLVLGRRWLPLIPEFIIGPAAKDMRRRWIQNWPMLPSPTFGAALWSV